MKRAALAALLLACSAPGARAAFDDLGAGARATGMGNAFVPVADDAYAIYYNPAGLGLLERPQFTAAYSKLYLGLTDGSDLSTSFLGYAQPLDEGRQGTLGTAWNSLALNNSLYRENTLFLSYGRRWFSQPDYGDLYAGLSLKYLESGFGTFDESANATLAGSIAKSGQADPLLSQHQSQSAFDADLGLLYRFGTHYAVGLSAIHVPQPNVAFDPAASDRLPLITKFGFDYRSLLSNLVAEVDTQRSPAGTRDQTLTVAAERWFPQLFLGGFGVRGGLGLGSRDYRQLSVGVSYRTKRLQFDYSFGIPVNSVASPAGDHRLAMSFRFGRTLDEEESLDLVLDAMRQLKASRVARHEVAEASLSAQQKAVLEEYLAQVRGLLNSAQYQEAFNKLSLALALAPQDPQLTSQYGRLNLVAQQIPSLPQYKTDPLQAALHEGLLDYLSGRDAQAVQKVSYALSLKPADHEFDSFLAQLETGTGIRRTPTPQVPAPGYRIAERLTRANSAIQDGNYDKAIELSLAVVKDEPGNAAAWEYLGTAYFARKDYDASLQAWQKALAYETNPDIRTAIRGYLRSASRAKQRLVRPAVGEPPALSAQERQALFDQGIDSYTRREFQKARAAFERILQAAPDDIEAQKALLRVKEELP